VKPYNAQALLAQFDLVLRRDRKPQISAGGV
jgi:hypothetical protein